MSQQPIPETCPLSRNAERAAPRFPIWPCTRWGFPCRVACASRGGLLPHLFTLTTVTAVYDRRMNSGAHRAPLQWRYLLCGTVRRDGSRRRRPRVSQPNKPGLRGIVLCGVRTFLPRLAPRAILRSSRTTLSLRKSRRASSGDIQSAVYPTCLNHKRRQHFYAAKLSSPLPRQAC